MLGRTQEVFDRQKIKRLRENSGMSIRELSLKTELNRKVLYKMENQPDYILSIENVAKIADALGYTLQDFLIDGIELRIKPKEL
jgi:transcriptional regulator with XRE-family HTH domain